MATLSTTPPTGHLLFLWRCRRACMRPAESLWASLSLLALLAVVLFFYGLEVGELWRTEGLRAIIAAEMLRSGDWIVPMLYGEPLLTKPPGMYVAIVLCSLPFGEVTDWSARLPSALAATATMLLLYWYFGRQLGRLGGLLAAVIVPLSPMWLEKATAAEIDMLQVAWTVAAILLFFRAVEDEYELPGQRVWRWWLLALLCVAGGVLTKWTTPVFFYLTAVCWLWWLGKLRLLWCRQHVVSAVVAVSLVLAWAGAAIHAAGWDTFYETVANEGLQRLSPPHSPRPYPWRESLLHPLKLLLTTLPFSAVALLTLRRGFLQQWDAKTQRLIVALHCWAWPSMLFMCFPTEHTPRHSFPLFPALSGLAAIVVFGWATGKLPWRLRWLRPGQALLAVVLVWLMMKLVFIHSVVPERNAARGPRAKAALLASLVPLDQILYIFRLKDEGIMFYYGRPVRRLRAQEQLPTQPDAVYCILLPTELAAWAERHRLEVLRQMVDEQGDPMILVRVSRA